jgi:short-subunit dehydrogenase
MREESMRSLNGKVVVITGASSGIGRATALMAARHGGAVVLVSRQEKALRELARECEAAGGHALAEAADVTDAQTLEKIARKGYQKFGHIDAWVNNAAVSLFAKFEEAPPEDYRRVIETNFFGYVNGARAVLPYFREQGRGVLINVSSMVGKAGAPYISAYTTSKFAINGWSESLRMELMDTPQIQVCTVLPASIDTPIFQHAANYTGRAIKPLPPVYPAEMVAEAILDCVHRPRREVYAGSAGAVMAKARVVAPETAEKMMARQVDKEHFQDAFEEPKEGNLYRPMSEFNTVSGNWREPGSEGGGQGRKVAGVAAAVAGLGAIGYLLRRRAGDAQRVGSKIGRTTRHASAGVRDQARKLVKPGSR